MVDPLTGAVAGEVAKAGGGVLSRLLGPTADEMGEQLLTWYRRRNVERVVGRAATKTQTDKPGRVPARVAAELFEKAQWADDEFVAEYLSGVLASARSVDGTDDRAIGWAALVGRLSSDQLRLHYSIYAGLRQRLVGEGVVDYTRWGSRKIVVAYNDLYEALGWDPDEDRLLNAAYGLGYERLINDLHHGDSDYLARPGILSGRRTEEGTLAVVCGASTRGMSLLLNAHGLGQLWPGAFASPVLNLESSDELALLAAPKVVWAAELPNGTRS